MFSFLIGLGAGVAVLLNGPSVRRGIARAVLQGGDALAVAGREARKYSAKMKEDFEDAFAEAKFERERSAAQQHGMSELAAQVAQLRADIASLHPQSDARVH